VSVEDIEQQEGRQRLMAMLAEAADMVAGYRAALLARGLPEVEAAVLARDFHSWYLYNIIDTRGGQE
jgi:hypothetical protein